jgi:hypothetical protein
MNDSAMPTPGSRIVRHGCEKSRTKRAQPNVLRDFTGALPVVGFTSAGVSPGGRQHRCVRDRASIDVLIPRPWTGC